MSDPLSNRMTRARAAGNRMTMDRARRALLALIGAERARGDRDAAIAGRLASGRAAEQIGRIRLGAAREPAGLACAQGCAFCCVLQGDDGGTITEAEARTLHAALAPLAGAPDGRAWHPKACAALDPETRACRAYDARPMICRSFVSTDADACAAALDGRALPGPGTLGAYHDYLAAIALSRAALKGTARVATYALARITAAAVEGADIDTALRHARHKPAELEAELKRSAKDTARAAPLP